MPIQGQYKKQLHNSGRQMPVWLSVRRHWKLMTTKQSDHDNDQQQQVEAKPGSSDGQLKEIMCWKDPYKVCKCENAQQGVYCGRFPIPTD